MIFTDSYAEQSCTAGRASFITGQCGLRTGLTKVGLPGAELGLKAEDTPSPGVEAARLPHWPVRQESPGRPRRAPADDAWIRRVLRQPVSPERRRGARGSRLPEREGLPQLQEELRAARRAALLGRWQGRPEDREHRAADEEADGNLRRRIPRRRPRNSSRPRTRPASRSSCGSTPRTCTRGPTSSRKAAASRGDGSRSTTT